MKQHWKYLVVPVPVIHRHHSVLLKVQRIVLVPNHERAILSTEATIHNQKVAILSPEVIIHNHEVAILGPEATIRCHEVNQTTVSDLLFVLNHAVTQCNPVAVS